jgi:HJR/Mrr/RecB family endonuclease
MAIDPEIVEMYTGQRRILTIELALHECNVAYKAYEQAKTKFDRAAWNHTVAGWRLLHARSSLAFANWVATCRLDPLVYFLLIIIPTSLLLGGLTAVLWRDSPWPAIVVALLPCLSLLLLLNTPKAEAIPNLNERAAGAAIAVQFAQAAMSQFRRPLEEAKASWLKASALYEGLIRAQQSLQQRLLDTDYQKMSGAEFEQFLAEIFKLLGYKVEATGQAGDQGVDLIIQKDVKIAVQAKCWNDSVPNKAVQEVFAGMCFYRCVRCAVIASSSFKKSARELALSTGCTLIEGNQIEDLIRGRINL